MNEEQLKNKYTLARRAYANNHFEESYSYYKEILNEEPNDYEAVFRLAISRVHTTAVLAFDEIYRTLAFDIPGVFNLESFKALEDHRKLEAVNSMVRDFTNTTILCEQVISGRYVQFQELDGSLSEYRNNLINVSYACGLFGEAIYNCSDNEEIKKACVVPLKNASILLYKSAEGLSATVFNAMRSKLGGYTYMINQFEPNYVNPCLDKLNKANAPAKENTTNTENSSQNIQETINSISAVIGKAFKTLVLILAVIVNTIVSFFLGCICISIMINPTNLSVFSHILTILATCAATIISLPGFGRVLFGKKYHFGKRVLRWVIVFGILIVMTLINGAPLF